MASLLHQCVTHSAKRVFHTVLLLILAHSYHASLSRILLPFFFEVSRFHFLYKKFKSLRQKLKTIWPWIQVKNTYNILMVCCNEFNDVLWGSKIEWKKFHMKRDYIFAVFITDRQTASIPSTTNVYVRLKRSCLHKDTRTSLIYWTIHPCHHTNWMLYFCT